LIPKEIRDLYKTVWEISQKVLIDMSADRGAFICQSQSFNLFLAEPNFGKLTSMHFYCWKKGLKTGMYYLRTRPAVDAIKFTVDQQTLMTQTSTTTTTPSISTEDKTAPKSPVLKKQKIEDGEVCRKEEGCFVCGS